MKAKVSRGGGFRGALSYVHGKGEAEKAGGNMSGQSVQELAREFGITKKLRPDCKNPVWHCSLALPEGDRLSGQKWDELSADFMREMGMDPANFLYDVQRHSDTDHDHIHILASRIGLDGSLWHGQNDVFRAIEATQKLEQWHGLTLTPGLDMEVKKERKSLKHGELNMAIRTEIKPPRMVCQEAIDAVLQSDGVMSAPVFIERLEALGVRAVPSVASTGTMNGFSFEVEGVAFTGSKLGDGYKWASLQKNGIEYVKARDFEELADAKRAAAERAGAGQLGAVAGVGGPRSDAGSAAAALAAQPGAASAGGVRPGHEGAAEDAGQSGYGDEQPGGRGDGSQNGSAGRSDNGPLEASRQSADEHESGAGQHREALGATVETVGNGRVFGEVDAGRGEGAAASSALDQVNGAAGSVPDAGQRPAGGVVRGGWASRFKQVSAAKRHAAERELGGGGLGQGERAGAKVDERDRIEARTIDPSAYLEAQGFQVIREGRHLSVRQHGDEAYRCTRKDDGHWVTCDRYENGIGDNIALVAELEPGIGFAESVYRLSGAPSVAKATRPAPAPVVRQPPQMPAQAPADVKRGRAYLFERGITLETIEAAEKAGMLCYSARGGVLFVGRDEAGTAQNIMRRAVDASELVQKRDLFGTDKRYPQMLPGAPGTVLIVEGGTDALAAHDVARRGGKPLPTVLVSGGANVRSWIETPWVQQVLRLAKRVVVAFEREDSPEKQAKTDAAHQVQMQRLREVCTAEVIGWIPQAGIKDMAELNLHQQLQAKSHQVQSAQKEVFRP